MIVYKYVVPERIDVLRAGMIRFTQAAALNDPFESLPCMTQFMQRKTEEHHRRAEARFGKELADATLSFRRELGEIMVGDLPDYFGEFLVFLSLSANPNNLLMWSHYASEHRGFVIGFNSAHPFFAPGAHDRHGLMPVRYSQSRFVMPPNGLLGLADDAKFEANAGMLFTKSDDWRYEEELRLLAMPKDADKTINNPGQPAIHLYAFPPKIITRIIFGFKMSQADRTMIAELASAKYPKAVLSQSYVDETNFALRLVPYSEFVEQQRRSIEVRALVEMAKEHGR